MLRFFRQIRQKLLENGNLRKYFWYALGEILLVMIGILLALQINNWNEDKKSRKYELTMLKEVNEAMVLDSLTLDRWVPYLQEVQHSFHQLAAIKNNSEYSRDSLLYHFTIAKEYGMTLTINKSPFEAIKSGGLDKISNQEIRKDLAELYGYQVVNAEEWINEVLSVELFRRFETYSALDGFISVKAIPEDEGDVLPVYSIDDEEAFLKHPELDKFLLQASWPLQQTIRKLSEIKKQMNKLNRKIYIELER